LVGCGTQARYQLEALALVRPFRERAFSTAPGARPGLRRGARGPPGMPPGCRFTAVGSVRKAVEVADIVISITPSRTPLIRADWLAPGMHLTAVGSDSPTSRSSSRRSGARPIGSSPTACPSACASARFTTPSPPVSWTPDRVAAELGAITAGLKPGRGDDRRSPSAI